MTTPDIKISLPDYPSGTVTLTVPGNIRPSELWSQGMYYSLPVISEKPVHFAELPTAITPDQSLALLPKRRTLGLGLGSIKMSDDFDAPLGGELGFGEE
jgi:hypothetical protein